MITPPLFHVYDKSERVNDLDTGYKLEVETPCANAFTWLVARGLRTLNRSEGSTSLTELPPPRSIERTVFNPETGEELADFSGSDFGNQPEWDKRDLIGKGIIVRGLSEEVFAPEGSTYPPARSLLYNLMTDPTDSDAWGMFFTDKTTDRQITDGKENPDTSVVIKQARKALRKNGGRSFPATLEWVETAEATKNAPARGYYTLKRYVHNAGPLPEGI